MPSRDHVALYSVLVDGGEIAQEFRDRIKEIVVVDHLRLPDACTIVLSFPKAEGIDQQPFKIGGKLELRLGAKDEQASETLFRGDVVALEPEFGAGGCGLTVRCYDRAHLLHRSRKVRIFQNQTATDIVKKVVSESGLSFDGEASGAPHDFVQQDNQTDWDFIWDLAERCGFEFVVSDQTARFRRPGRAGTVELEWPGELMSFRPRVTAVQQVSEVTLLAHDPKTKQVIESSATRPEQVASIGLGRDEVTSAFDDATLHVATEPVKNRGEGDALTQALLDKLANGYIAAEGVAQGNPKIRAGVMVQVRGVGSLFSGSYRCASSHHVFRGGGSYITNFLNSPSHTVTGAVNGGGSVVAFGSDLVLGVVTNTNDPDSMGRVRVRYPALGDDAEGTWARIASTSAGKGRGVMMLPVVGEEVLVGFEHGDTTRPYVLGSLFNGSDLPGDELLQERNGSYAVRSDEAIYLESQKNYTTKVGGDVSNEVTGKVEEKVDKDWTATITGATTLTSRGAFKAEGQSVEISGQTEVKIKANATLTLSCGAAEIQLSPAGVKISGPLINLG
jgi:phage protein D